MKLAPIGLIILLAAGIAVIVLALDIVQLPDDTFFQQELNNTGHTPLFGFLALTVLAMSRLSLPSLRLNAEWHYGIALILTALIGVFSELIQISGSRDADPIDFIRDLTGIVSFLTVHYSFSSHGISGREPKFGRMRLWCRIFGILLFLGSLVPLGLVGISYHHRDQTFPRIADFESYWGDLFLVPSDAQLQRVPYPQNLPDNPNTMVAEVILGMAEYPGMAISEVYPDWHKYKFLSFEVYSEQTDTVYFGVRVNDMKHDNDFYDRFNHTLVIAPGLNRFRILLEDIRTAPRTREMDMHQIDAFVLFAISPTEPITVYIDNIILE